MKPSAEITVKNLLESSFKDSILFPNLYIDRCQDKLLNHLYRHQKPIHLTAAFPNFGSGLTAPEFTSLLYELYRAGSISIYRAKDGYGAFVIDLPKS